MITKKNVLPLLGAGIIGLVFLGAGPVFASGGSISQVSQQSVRPGDTLTITGSGFGSPGSALRQVCVGGSIAGWCVYGSGSGVQEWSDSQITITIPSYASRSGQLVVEVTPTSTFRTYTITGPDIYVYPVVAQIYPTTVYPGQDIKISAPLFSYSFGDVKGSVLLGGVNLNVKTWSSNEIVVTAPVINPGYYDLVVQNPAGGQSTPQSVTVNAPPVISGISPSQVIPGVTNLCIFGQNFGTSQQNWSGRTSNSSLKMGNIAITLASWSDTKICFDVPSTVTYAGSISLSINGYDIPGRQSYSIASSDAASPVAGGQYYLKSINANDGWSLQRDSANVVVAVIDDGIYVNHPNLAQNIWVNQRDVVGNGIDDDKNGYIDDIYGWDFLGDTSEMTVRGSHGTRVAGIIGATPDTSSGVTGITSRVKLMSLIACDPRIGCPTKDVIEAIYYAADNGADIINLSLGSRGTTNYTSAYDAAVSYAYKKGVVIIAAGGNGDVEGGLGQDTGLIPASPVCNKSEQGMILGVGAVDDQNNITRWSNWGKCVHVLAPGKTIYSTSVPLYDDNKFFSAEDGTSFAAPIVTGIAALLKGRHPSMPNHEIIARIKRNTNNFVVDLYKTLYESYTPPSVLVSSPTQEISVNPSLTDTSQIFEKEKGFSKGDLKFSKSKSGRLLAQNGVGLWYVNPANHKKYPVFSGTDLLGLIQKKGLFLKDKKFSASRKAPRAYYGRFIVNTIDWKQYYVDPKDGRVYLIDQKNYDAAVLLLRGTAEMISDKDARRIAADRL